MRACHNPAAKSPPTFVPCILEKIYLQGERDRENNQNSGPGRQRVCKDALSKRDNEELAGEGKHNREREDRQRGSARRTNPTANPPIEPACFFRDEACDKIGRREQPHHTPQIEALFV